MHRTAFWRYLAHCGAIAAISMACTLPSRAADGELDPTFGTQGRATFDWPDGWAEPRAIAVDAQGRIGVAGSGTRHAGYTNPQFLITRLLPDGARDPAFATDQDGWRTFAFNLSGLTGHSEDRATSVNVYPDGSLLVAGNAFFGGRFGHAAVIRLTPAGALDTGFGTAGSTHFGLFQADSTTIATSSLTADGRVLLAGEALYRPVGSALAEGRVMLARMTADGLFATGFGYGGLAEFHYAPQSAGHQAHAQSIAMEAGGGITVVGTEYTAEAFSAGALHVDARGARVLSFGNGGSVVFGPQILHLTAAVALPDGRTMVAGTSDSFGLVLLRLNADGSVDTSFGQAGVATAPAPAEALLLAKTRAGRWVAAGPDNGTGAFVARFTAEGERDDTFGTHGVAQVIFEPSGLFYAARPVMDAQGRVLVAGYMPEHAAAGIADFGVMRVIVDTDALFIDGFESAP
ncbi:hypothetical protein [Tahibacter amnicola]|uniref:Delta-60 repeat protein n=1 Tax=Tahibacter amnicola TaxID=2976241 RepID=A0ABY6B9H7_9GAMM|nr:hypothetical protein [Tahibacter amnicola]UXI66510.1 hypothetical protein N4264_17370 [Tahibacter amnicola]